MNACRPTTRWVSDSSVHEMRRHCTTSSSNTPDACIDRQERWGFQRLKPTTCRKEVFVTFLETLDRLKGVRASAPG